MNFKKILHVSLLPTLKIGWHYITPFLPHISLTRIGLIKLNIMIVWSV